MKDHPDQLYLFQDYEVIPRGDGSYVAKPTGKPQRWLWVGEAARLMRVSEDSVRRWAREGLITGRRVGMKKYQIEADSLRQFLEPMNHLR